MWILQPPAEMQTQLQALMEKVPIPCAGFVFAFVSCEYRSHQHKCKNKQVKGMCLLCRLRKPLQMSIHAQ